MLNTNVLQRKFDNGDQTSSHYFFFFQTGSESSLDGAGGWNGRPVYNLRKISNFILEVIRYYVSGEYAHNEKNI
jgi:hypothetical protein